MKIRIFYLLVLLTLTFFPGCSSDSMSDPVVIADPEPPVVPTPGYEYLKIPEYNQRNGDPSTGYDYLINGDYMSSGIPYEVYVLAQGEDNSNLLNREGKNAKIPHDLNVVTHDNGVEIVAPNCLQCHSARINNELILGLGNHSLDFSIDRATEISTLSTGIQLLYGTSSKEWEAFKTFKKSLEVVGPRTITKVRGVNPADKTTVVLASYRDKNTLEQLDNPTIEVTDEVIPSDVPAWWLLKKKNALFYHGIGRKDHGRSMITMIIAALENAEKAIEVDGKMKDVLAYINSLNAPQYPFDIDDSLAKQGKVIFTENCATCHGNYGENESYPNKLVALTTIGTDPELSNYYTKPSAESDFFIDWFNTGWFSSGVNGLEVIAEGGYVAPPLDGVWATAPYFHNGSVPTLEDVLNSKNRPNYWRRSFKNDDYDEVKVGWNYSLESMQADQNTYNTNLKGYGNGGHTFGDHLSSSERTAVLEYLKTL